MEFIGLLGNYIIPFLLVLTVLVAVHEWGHYAVARWCGVRVEVFSVGFGKELFGLTDRAGTRWKFSAIPLGGYVKMFGEPDVVGGEVPDTMTAEERAQSFSHKSLGRRAAIVAAGPIANFLFAIIVLSISFMTMGQHFTPAEVGGLLEDTPAEQAGLQIGDRILEIDGKSILRFEEMQQIVQLHPGRPLNVVVSRDGRTFEVEITPTRRTREDMRGNAIEFGLIGIRSPEGQVVHHGPVDALWLAGRETIRLTQLALTTLGQILTLERPVRELAGPVGLAQISGEVAKTNYLNLIILAAYLSINLGLVNLFPIPILDGGHLLFYAAEGIRGKPLGPRVQEYGFRIGLAFLLTFMLFVTWNDLAQLPLVEFIANLMT